MTEAIQYAPEPQTAPTRDLPVLHYYWPSEFPIALCGAISKLDKLPDRNTARRGLVCEKCRTIRNHTTTTRRNPHQPDEPEAT